MKQFLSVLLAVVLCVAFGSAAFASDLETESIQLDNSVNNIATGTANNKLTITSGIAYCKTYVSMKSGYTAKTSTILQKYSNGSWEEVITWSYAKTSKLDVTETKAVSQGTYRLKTYVNVYNSQGTFVETDTIISPSQP